MTEQMKWFPESSEISWNNSITEDPNDVAAKHKNDIAENDVKTTFSPNGSFLKTHKNGDVQFIEPTDFGKRDTFIRKMHPDPLCINPKTFGVAGTESPYCDYNRKVVDNYDQIALCNFSNNYDGLDGENDNHENCEATIASGKKPASSLPTPTVNKSDYTEYAPGIMTCTFNKTKSKKEVSVSLASFRDFSKYDKQPQEERTKQDSYCSTSYKRDILLLGDESKRQNAPRQLGHSKDQSVYFNAAIPEIVRHDQSKSNVGNLSCPVDEDYQGGFFYTTSYEKNYNNSSDDDASESYTGCFRNVEELKPTHDDLFNDKASSFVFQKRKIDSNPAYFCDSGTKSYYDTEDSIYAFERKPDRELPEKKLSKLLRKVGGIIARDNVESEMDYAKNINMDLHQTPNTWVQYDDADTADPSSYAQNVSFEENEGLKPWVAGGIRAPWREAGNLSMSNDVRKKTRDENMRNGSWKETPDKMAKSVKSLRSYVARWF